MRKFYLPVLALLLFLAGLLIFLVVKQQSLSAKEQQPLHTKEEYFGSYESSLTWCRERDLYIDKEHVHFEGRLWAYNLRKDGSLALAKDGPYLVFEDHQKNSVIYSSPNNPKDVFDGRSFKKCS